MKALKNALANIPEIAELMQRIEGGRCPVAVTGVAPVHRSQIAAAVALELDRPLVMVCPDEKEADRLCLDLRTLMGREPLRLTARDFQLSSAAFSRGWEHRRLSALYTLSREKKPVVVATVDALMQRTIPPEVLKAAALSLQVGGKAEPQTIAEQLTAAGYTRCEQVEGVGQFALRGGILDVFSPMMDQPVRCEFFDDEIDSCGLFDTATQRRVKNIKSALILPASEFLPAFAPGGVEGLWQAIEKQADKAKQEKLAQTLRADASRLREGVAVEGPDRYIAALYGKMTTGLTYLPADALLCLSESARCDEAARGRTVQSRQDTEALLSAGVLCGEWSSLYLSAEELFAQCAEFAAVMMDALPTSRYPLQPRGLLSVAASCPPPPFPGGGSTGGCPPSTPSAGKRSLWWWPRWTP